MGKHYLLKHQGFFWDPWLRKNYFVLKLVHGRETHNDMRGFEVLQARCFWCPLYFLLMMNFVEVETKNNKVDLEPCYSPLSWPLILDIWIYRQYVDRAYSDHFFYFNQNINTLTWPLDDFLTSQWLGSKFNCFLGITVVPSLMEI